MIFIIPIILGAAALVTAGVGVSAGADGVSKLQKAQKIGKSAEQRYKKANKSLEKKFQATQKFGKRSGGLKKKKDKPFPSSHKIRQLSKSHLHQNK
jgi:hypothetical protein